jgi:hypothetical protein
MKGPLKVQHVFMDDRTARACSISIITNWRTRTLFNSSYRRFTIVGICWLGSGQATFLQDFVLRTFK